MTAPTNSLTERLSKCYTGVVQDVMQFMGLRDYVLPWEIQALQNGMSLCGPAYTVSGRIDNTLTPHETLSRWTQFLGSATPHSVVVCQPNNHVFALMGELSAETLKLRGIRGYLVDGGCRDVSMILKIGFPVFCRFRTPADIVGKWAPDTFEKPITIANVTISPGDYILGDMDGALSIPKHCVEEVVQRSEVMINTENKVRTAIIAGMDPHEAYVKYGKF